MDDGPEAHCTRCLGAHLLASELRRDVDCPGCGATWRDRPPPERRVDVPADLRAIARWLPDIIGRAWRPAEAGGHGAPVDGRPDRVDAHHRDARSGLRTAMAALTRLDAMERAGYGLEADVLWFAYVASGEALAARHGGVEQLVAAKFTPPGRLAHWKGHKSRRVRQVQMHSRGEGLLAHARDAYEAHALGQLAPRATRPGDVLRQLSRDAEAVRARIEGRLARVARVANN